MSSAERQSFKVPTRESFLNEVIIPSGVSGVVVSAFEEVDRAQFTPRALRDRAYTDAIIDLSDDSTISQPSLVARMLDLLGLGGHERVLEIGSATGYQAALLSRLAARVDTIEADPLLAYSAFYNLNRLRYLNVTVHEGDGAKGLGSRSPFDAIIVTAALKSIPKTLIDQLAVGGCLIAPLGEVPEDCNLVALTKTSPTETSLEDHGWCTFVPLFSQEEGGWTKGALKKAREAREIKRQERLARRRQQLRVTILQNCSGEEQVYREVIRSIEIPVARIVGKRLTEDMVLDLVDYFSGLMELSDKEPET